MVSLFSRARCSYDKREKKRERRRALSRNRAAAYVSFVWENEDEGAARGGGFPAKIGLRTLCVGGGQRRYATRCSRCFIRTCRCEEYGNKAPSRKSEEEIGGPRSARLFCPRVEGRSAEKVRRARGIKNPAPRGRSGLMKMNEKFTATRISTENAFCVRIWLRVAHE